jgi:hypothetical protein
MSLRVCLATHTLGFVGGAGHLWAYLNWALGLKALGCEVFWLEFTASAATAHQIQTRLVTLREQLAAWEIVLALATRTDEPLPSTVNEECAGLDAVVEADVLVNFNYGLPARIVKQFRRSTLIDIDPGLLQIWMTEGQIPVAPHDVYCTIGETIGRVASECPDAGVEWHHIRPAVFLAEWPPSPASRDAPYTTVSNWWGEWVQWGHVTYDNAKRVSFLEFVDLPRRVAARLELALYLGQADKEKDDRHLLESHGWQVRHAREIASTPWDYRDYIQRSRGEFSCAKPAYVKLRTAWISDRTLCYLASGKPVVVQHTGRSRFLPECSGMFRFNDIDEAARYLDMIETDYATQSREARAVAEEYFDAVRVLRQVLQVSVV